MISSSGFSAFSGLFSSILRIASWRHPLHRRVGPRAALIRSIGSDEWGEAPKMLRNCRLPGGLRRYGSEMTPGVERLESSLDDRHRIVSERLRPREEIVQLLLDGRAERLVPD